MKLICDIWCKCDKRGWFAGWPPWSFSNPMWHSDTRVYTIQVFCQWCFHLFWFPLTFRFLIALWLSVLFLFSDSGPGYNSDIIYSDIIFDLGSNFS